MEHKMIKCIKTDDGYQAWVDNNPKYVGKSNNKIDAMNLASNELRNQNEIVVQIANSKIMLEENSFYDIDVKLYVCEIPNDERKKILLNSTTLNSHANLMIRGMLTLVENHNFTGANILLRPILENICIQFYLNLCENSLDDYWSHWMDDLVPKKQRNELRNKYKLTNIIPKIYKNEKANLMNKVKNKYNEILHLNPMKSDGGFLPSENILHSIKLINILILLNRLALIQNCYKSSSEGHKFYEHEIKRLLNYNNIDVMKFIPNDIISYINEINNYAQQGGTN